MRKCEFDSAVAVILEELCYLQTLIKIFILVATIGFAIIGGILVAGYLGV